MAEQGTGRQQRRNGRGQLSSIDLLPEVADDAIAWANAELRERSMPQGEILRGFNARLADHGIGAISRSAFSRHSVRLAIELRKLRAGREITNTLLERIPPGDRDDMMLAAVEIVKAQLLDVILEDDDPDSKSLAHASLALARLSSTRQREAEGNRRSEKHRREEAEREEARQREREAAEATATTAERVVAEAGLTAERVAAIRRGVLGLAEGSAIARGNHEKEQST
ncbi:MAG: phage protein Gp27 family protein [Novosphingobium sp.]